MLGTRHLLQEQVIMLDLSADAFADFIEKLPVAIACFDEDRKYFAINHAFADLNGVSREDTIGKPLAEVLPDLVDVLSPIFDRVYLHQEHINDTLIEGKTPSSDEVRYWMACYQPIALTNGKTGLLVTAKEVTQQIFANKSAESDRKLLTDVLNSLFTFVGLLDVNGVLLDTNKAPLAAAGIALKDVQGKHFWDCYWWTYSTATIALIKQAIIDVQNGEAVRFDIDVRVSSGFITIDFMMEGLRNSDGDLTHIIPSGIDISERKKAEKQLRLSQSRFETVTNRTVDGLVACDPKGIIHFVNTRFEDLVGVKVEINKANIYDYLDDTKVLSSLTDLIENVKIDGIHAAIQNANMQRDVCLLKPTLKPVEIAFSPLLDSEEVLFLATISDVSALYESNLALENALQEKTILLNEVHHRVKNNLQVMSSLLNLQANSEGTDTVTKNALLDSQRRLKSMALIHQLLYEREDFTYANLQQFTSKLLDLLQDSMANGSDVTVSKAFTVTPITLTLNQIVPLGFLITELITNAFKHAFIDTNMPDPTITVSMQEVEGIIELTVADNGTGIIAASATAKTSLGRDLINIFTRQLHANLETTSHSGVSHTMQFKNQTPTDR